MFMCDKNETQFRMLECAVEEVFARCDTKRNCLESRMLKPSDYGKSISNDEAIHDHRTTDALHVSLQVLAFGKFMATVKSEDEDSVPSQFYHVASKLMQEMSVAFKNEAGRLKCFKDTIKVLGDNFKVNSEADRGYRSDGVVKDNDGNILVNWEFKNELFGNSSCPNRQNITYFIYMKKGKTGRSPMLLVSVVGCHYLQVFGAAWDREKRACVDPLSSPVSLLFVPRDPSYGVTKVAKVREAKCFGNIDAECDRLVLPPTVRRSSSSQQQLRGDHKLQHDFLQYLEERKVKWSPTLTKNTWLLPGCQG